MGDYLWSFWGRFVFSKVAFSKFYMFVWKRKFILLLHVIEREGQYKRNQKMCNNKQNVEQTSMHPLGKNMIFLVDKNQYVWIQ